MTGNTNRKLSASELGALEGERLARLHNRRDIRRMVVTFVVIAAIILIIAWIFA